MSQFQDGPLQANARFSKIRIPMAGWVWSETRDIDFPSVFCPFVGSTVIAQMLKEQGREVIAADILHASGDMAKALIENDYVTLDPFEIDALCAPNDARKQLFEVIASSYGMAPEDGAWLDNYRANINNLDDEYKKALALSIGTCIIRYLLSFTPETADVKTEEDLGMTFRYYVESFNDKIYNNGTHCAAHIADVNTFVETVQTAAIFFYVPSPLGFQDLSREQRFMEMFHRDCNDAELDAAFLNAVESLGKHFEDMNEYRDAFESFLARASHIPTWFIAYNKAGSMTAEEVERIIRKFKNNVAVNTKDIIYREDHILTEYLFIGKD